MPLYTMRSDEVAVTMSNKTSPPGFGALVDILFLNRRAVIG